MYIFSCVPITAIFSWIKCLPEIIKKSIVLENTLSRSSRFRIISNHSWQIVECVNSVEISKSTPILINKFNLINLPSEFQTECDLQYLKTTIRYITVWFLIVSLLFRFHAIVLRCFYKSFNLAKLMYER